MSECLIDKKFVLVYSIPIPRGGITTKKENLYEKIIDRFICTRCFSFCGK